MTRRWSYVLPAAIVAGSMAFVSTAKAQSYYDSPAKPETTTQSGPNADLIGVGVFTIALPYFASVGVAMGNSVDKDLYIPVAGPWLDLAHRPECGGLHQAQCDDMEPFYKVLLIEDGILQGIGALEVLAGMASSAPRHEEAKASKPSLHVAPAPVGHTGYGIGAVGTF